MGPQPSRLTDKIVLFIIDPQVDFLPTGSLGVPGSDEDAERIAALIMEHVDEIDEIYVTLDSHNRNHISHAIFWENERKEQPRPFTLISHEDVGTKWWPRDRKHLAWCKEYTAQLAEGNRFMHCIWPEHCLIGTKGQCVVPCVNAALQHWAGKRLRNIRYVHKGMNNLTEMYSCVQADVPVDTDPTTLKNTELMRKLLSCKRLMICGQASTHSVHFTTLDILHDCPSGHEGRMVLLVDAMSPVTGCEDKAVEFVEYVKSKGVTISTTADIFDVPCIPLPPMEERAHLHDAAMDDHHSGPYLNPYLNYDAAMDDHHSDTTTQRDRSSSVQRDRSSSGAPSTSPKLERKNSIERSRKGSLAATRNRSASSLPGFLSVFDLSQQPPAVNEAANEDDDGMSGKSEASTMKTESTAPRNRSTSSLPGFLSVFDLTGGTPNCSETTTK